MINKYDVINASFELAGAALRFIDVKKLWSHRELRGIHWGSTMFFTGWGVWNLIFFPAISFWFSLVAGFILFSMNTAWVSMAIAFYKKQ